MDDSDYDISEGKSEIEPSEKIYQKCVLPMHSMHAQAYHFLACAPILLQNREDQYGSP